jgi:hypothetical protein
LSDPTRDPAPITDEDMREFIASVRWQFAKTMADIPHEYTVKFWLDKPGLEMFYRVVIHIRHHGYDEKFGRKTFRYYDLDGFKYWTMGNSLHVTKLINRARIDSE